MSNLLNQYLVINKIDTNKIKILGKSLFIKPQINNLYTIKNIKRAHFNGEEYLSLNLFNLNSMRNYIENTLDSEISLQILKN